MIKGTIAELRQLSEDAEGESTSSCDSNSSDSSNSCDIDLGGDEEVDEDAEVEDGEEVNQVKDPALVPANFEYFFLYLLVL